MGSYPSLPSALEPRIRHRHAPQQWPFTMGEHLIATSMAYRQKKKKGQTVHNLRACPKNQVAQSYVDRRKLPPQRFWGYSIKRAHRPQRWFGTTSGAWALAHLGLSFFGLIPHFPYDAGHLKMWHTGLPKATQRRNPANPDADVIADRSRIPSIHPRKSHA